MEKYLITDGFGETVLITNNIDDVKRELEKHKPQPSKQRILYIKGEL